jgi:hypothetical protein
MLFTENIGVNIFGKKILYDRSGEVGFGFQNWDPL